MTKKGEGLLRISMRFWHYTTSHSFKGIMGSEKIKCDKKIIQGKISCVFLSTNSKWEEVVRKAHLNKKTCSQSKPLSTEGIYNAGFFPIRIEINPDKVSITDWQTHCKKIPLKISLALEKTAKEWGANPAEWWVSYEPIPIDSFIFPIEMWNGRHWVAAIEKE